ncbi:MAG: MBL fold metallo-hydrolase [Salinivirgaceae bacterium]|nr:MBL fold metallo-hydrolase [Salinivirgaceae bacterium]
MLKQLKKISDSIYILPHYSVTDRPTLGVISGTKYSLIVDAGNSYAHADLFNQQIQELNLQQTKALVNTHWHWDHCFGNSYYNIPIIANNYTKTEIEKQSRHSFTDLALDKRVKEGAEIEFCAEHIKKEYPDPNRVIKMKIPDQIIDGKTEIDLGNLTCVLESVDSDHCEQNLLVFIPEQKVLFIGDALYMNLYAKEWNYTTEKLFPFLEKLASYNAEIIVGSHSDPLSKTAYLKYFDELRTIGNIVKDKGDNYEKIMDGLNAINFSFDDYTKEIIKAFIAGL